ncbi:amidohydrolase family protein [Pseudoalteromonas sp. M8]|uniref:amidohydrolase family protein n=1 Tax=Pseudoalteromonas sp. M8 TaxID=2692624 RepID=UPI001BAD79EF|nr:amidohydrolase family protein [Pseudoalteromonas sp. M8]QUI70396.1 amidohydrolase family protein [Pseudoalteromonas sp. M8]
MKVIDAHLHLNSWQFPKLDEAINELEHQMTSANISKAVLLHLQIQPWSKEELAKALSGKGKFIPFVNIHPMDEDAKQALSLSISKLGYQGLKLHPRLQKYSPDDERVITLCRYSGELNAPVLLDAFPDGTALMQGFDPLAFARLAKACPDTSFIWAHMGGHKVIDFMMLAKRLPNVFMDCSYSLLYYRGSSVVDDLMYAMKSMRYDRIFYGSDYPDRSLSDSLTQSLEQFKKYNVQGEALEKILVQNFEDLIRD